MFSPVTGQFEIVYLFYTVPEQEHIQIAIMVVIEKSGLGTIARIVQPVLRGLIFEMQIALVDEQLVSAFIGVLTRIADIDIEQAVAVHIGRGAAGFPAIRPSLETCLFSDIFKMKTAEIQIQLTRFAIGGKKKIDQSVIIDVAGGYSSPVIKIFIGKHVELFCLLYIVAEMNA